MPSADKNRTNNLAPESSPFYYVPRTKFYASSTNTNVILKNNSLI